MPTIWTALKCGTVIHLLFYKYSAIQTTLKCGIVIHLLFYKYSAIQTTLKCRFVIHLVFFFTNTLQSKPLWNVDLVFFYYKYCAIQTTLKCGFVIHLVFFLLQILRNPNRFEMWHLNSDIGLHTVTSWTTLKCRLVIHLLFYNEMRDLPILLVHGSICANITFLIQNCFCNLGVDAIFILQINNMSAQPFQSNVWTKSVFYMLTKAQGSPSSGYSADCTKFRRTSAELIVV